MSVSAASTAAVIRTFYPVKETIVTEITHLDMLTFEQSHYSTMDGPYGTWRLSETSVTSQVAGPFSVRFLLAGVYKRPLLCASLSSYISRTGDKHNSSRGSSGCRHAATVSDTNLIIVQTYAVYTNLTYWVPLILYVNIYIWLVT